MWSLAAFGDTWGRVMAYNKGVPTYILAGQSNARGSANFTDTPTVSGVVRTATSNAYLYDCANSGGGGTTDILHLQISSTGNTNQTNTGKLGCEGKLCKSLMDTLGEDVFLLKYAIGGTSLAVDWLPSSGATLVNFKTEMLAAQTKAATLGMPLSIKGILWWQGESDSQNGTWAAAYEANFTALIADMRAFFGNPVLPFLAVALDNDDGAAYPHMATVNTAISNVIAATSNAYLIDETPFTWTDTIHASTASCEAVGAAAATQFLAID